MATELTVQSERAFQKVCTWSTAEEFFFHFLRRKGNNRKDLSQHKVIWDFHQKGKVVISYFQSFTAPTRVWNTCSILPHARLKTIWGVDDFYFIEFQYGLLFYLVYLKIKVFHSTQQGYVTRLITVSIWKLNENLSWIRVIISSMFNIVFRYLSSPNTCQTQIQLTILFFLLSFKKKKIQCWQLLRICNPIVWTHY